MLVQIFVKGRENHSLFENHWMAFGVNTRVCV